MLEQAVRERTGLLPNTDVEFVVDGNAVRIIKAASDKGPSRGATAVRRLRGAGGRLRRRIRVT